MHEQTTQELTENVTKAAKISGDKMAEAFSIFNKNLAKAEGAFVGLGKTLESARPIKNTLKKKRGARYTKRRICKRTGRSSSH